MGKNLDNFAAIQWRSACSQIIAVMAPCFLLFDLGLAIGFITISSPMLLNAKDDISLTAEQLSWYGSIMYLIQPIGAVISGPVVDYLGRRKANFIVNLPHLIAWLLLYYSWNVSSLFMSIVLLGFGGGIMEAPLNAYVGEVSEPALRGALCTFALMFVWLGLLIMYFLGTLLHWRQVAIMSFAVPVTSMVFCLLAPETPVWLLSKGRDEDALKSLCHLRGWTVPEQVQDEYHQLVEYTKKLQECVICAKTERRPAQCIHEDMNIFRRSWLKFRCIMLGKQTMKPMLLVMIYFFLYVMTGATPIRSNMVNVCAALGMADDATNIVFIVGIISFLSAGILIFLIKVFGKRKLALTSMLGVALISTALTFYAKNNLDESVSSYDADTFPTEKSMVPLVLFYVLNFLDGLAVPWVIIGEVFPFRSRACAQGFAAAGNYVITFLAAKTFFNFETSLHLWGALAVYTIIAYAGAVYLYFFLPETEGKSLQEIEYYFRDGFRIFADDPFSNFFRRFGR